MNELLHPSQVAALEKLKGLRVGALYMDRQDGKLRAVLELVRDRLRRGRIDSVLWLCTRARCEALRESMRHSAPELTERVTLYGIETLSHNLGLFMALRDWTRQRRAMLVIDNGLLIKNSKALRTQRVLAISVYCPYRLLISDVPFTRHVADMFSQWYALDWRILGYRTYWGFCLNHLRANRRGCNVAYLARAIAPYCAQVLRNDVQSVAGRREFVWRFALPQEAMAEYRRVMERFLEKAVYSSAGVYRLLQACQLVACGRRIARDFPLETAPMYAAAAADPRCQALLEVTRRFEGKRLLILCRFRFECERVYEALCAAYGRGETGRYPACRHNGRPFRLLVMNYQTDERETARLRAEVVIYYSSGWDWRVRMEKEERCRQGLQGEELTVVSLAAAETVDMKILKCIWEKESLVERMRRELKREAEKS